MGAVRDLEGRPRRLGRHRARLSSSARSSRSARASTSRSSRTAWRPASSSRRASAASATGGTRSSSAGRRTCPGVSRSHPENRPIDYVDQETFHPTFLYEALWCFAAAGVLLFVERRFKGGSGRAGSSRSTCSSTASGGSGSRCSASTRRTSRRGAPERLGRRARDRALRRVLRLVAADVEARPGTGAASEGRDHGGPEERSVAAGTLSGALRCIDRRRSKEELMRYSRRSLRSSSPLSRRAGSQRGGWATVGFEPLPDGIGRRRARGTPTIFVKQHGITPLAGLQPGRHDRRRHGSRPATFVATETSEAGVYEADRGLPDGGRLARRRITAGSATRRSRTGRWRSALRRGGRRWRARASGPRPRRRGAGAPRRRSPSSPPGDRGG